MSGKKERWENLVSGNELTKARTARKKKTMWKRIRESELESFEPKGWDAIATYANGDIKIEKELPIETAFENRVWLMFNLMGYTTMNKDDNFCIGYSKHDPGLTKQIDVFAMDDETILVVECKTAKKPGSKKEFLKEIGEFSDKTEGIRNSLYEWLKGSEKKRPKIQFIWATKNCILGEKDKARLDEAHMIHFGEEEIDYYTDLAHHLGESAKYQLLGKLFAKKKIEGMPETVPAIRGQMGKHTYYSFSIEPERLLKIAYVLHRSDANYNLMPTYQRIIKKSRLKEVRDFVDAGNYFPNSIIISVERKRGGRKIPLQFDEVSANETDSDVKLGILHLPQLYCSAYIIDGQHRLYGYTGSKYAKTNTIPVVAFENLDRGEQVRLFMDINQNQKAVPKNLRNTLNASLLYDSPNPAECRIGLRAKIAQQLGEDPSSPLRDRVIVGENKRNDIRCVTMETIDKGLREGRLLTSFSKDGSMVKQGLLDTYARENDFAYDKLIPFLYQSFDYFKTELPEEWEKGQSEQALLTNNTGVYALLRCFSDILEFLSSNNQINTQTATNSQLVEACEPYYQAIASFYSSMSDEMAENIRNNYGGNGARDHWRYMQKGIHDAFPPFNPDGLDGWWNDNSKARNEPARQRLDAIDRTVKSLTKDGLIKLNGDNWEDEIPESLVIKYAPEIAKSKKKHRLDEAIPEKTYWDCITLANCRTIALDGANWSSHFKAIFTRPGQKGRKDDLTSWIDRMSKLIRELNRGKGKSISIAEYEDICAISDWLCPHAVFKDVDND